MSADLTAGDLSARHVGLQLRITSEGLSVAGYLESISVSPGPVNELGSYVSRADVVDVAMVRPRGGSAAFRVPLDAEVEWLR